MLHRKKQPAISAPSGSAFLTGLLFGGLLLALLASVSPASAQESCADCHETDPEAFAETVHGFLECADCHSGTDDLPHADELDPVDCSMCHDDVDSDYAGSAHGRSRLGGDEDAPLCANCHGSVHTLLPKSDPNSPVHPSRLPETCGTCHSDPVMAAKHGIPLAQPIEAYHASVHGRLSELGADPEAATCNDCHDSHAIFGAEDPRSTVNHQNVPATCGKCHVEVTEAYDASVHGLAAAHGTREAPVCTDCHGEHKILGPGDSGSPVFASNVPKMTCGRCHGDLRLAEKYGMASESVSAYDDSYHGLAMRSGKATVAHCASCHGTHDIQPSSNPTSHIHADNLAETCGQCHPGAGTRFAIGQVHVQPSDREHTAVFWIREIYLWMIYLTIGGMILHNLADLYRKARNPLPRPDAGFVVREERMSKGFRIAHVLMIVSFGLLVYTGFALKYPESWWARPLLAWEDSLGLRGWLHRFAGILMLVSLFFHLAHIAVDRHARRVIAGMLPKWEDVTEFREKMLWFAGIRKDPPHAPSLGYPEKMEYLALMWGIVVMTVTGFLLWFDDLLLRFLPTWVADVATVIHFYEAVLASLAIAVWHFYFVLLDPVIYPMDTAWLTGRSHPGRVFERQAHAEGEDDSKDPLVAPPRALPTPKSNSV